MISKENAASLEKEIAWFSRVLETRITLYFEQDHQYKNIYDIPPPDLEGDGSEYARIVKASAMSFDERVVLILSLLPHIRPQVLDTFFIRNSAAGKPRRMADFYPPAKRSLSF